MKSSYYLILIWKPYIYIRMYFEISLAKSSNMALESHTSNQSIDCKFLFSDYTFLKLKKWKHNQINFCLSVTSVYLWMKEFWIQFLDGSFIYSTYLVNIWRENIGKKSVVVLWASLICFISSQIYYMRPDHTFSKLCFLFLILGYNYIFSFPFLSLCPPI